MGYRITEVRNIHPQGLSPRRRGCGGMKGGIVQYDHNNSIFNSNQTIIALEPNFGKVSHSTVMNQTWAAIETPVLEPTTHQSDNTKNDRGWMVTVYNNDYNTDIEVIAILMIATKCDAEEASIETWEIDKLGQSIVHRASQKECEEAARIIATIGIRVEAEPDPLA